MRIYWLPAAAYALDREYDLLVTRNPKATRAVFARIAAMVVRLAEFPYAGRPGQIAGTRELVIPSLPYLVIYRVNEERIEVLRVFHTARDWHDLMS